MKIFIFYLLALAFAFTLAADVCDPDSNGQPECTSNNVGQPFRNFWDPIHYWLCVNATGNPESVRCPTETMFDDGQKQCISWRVWNWTNPCPDLEESPNPNEPPKPTEAPEAPKPTEAPSPTEAPNPTESPISTESA